ncbi:MAG: YdcF family protein [Pseudomonadota bacterium]
MGSLEDSQPPRAVSAVPEAEVIVVLGGGGVGEVHLGQLGDIGTASNRVLKGAALYKAHKAPWLLLSGGSAPEERSDAERMRDVLTLMGVPKGAVITESRSRDTRQNALFTADILEQRRLERIILVTSAYHMRRALAAFDHIGVVAYAVPTDYQRSASKKSASRWLPSVENLERSTKALREYVGWWYYRFQGWI